MYLVKSPLLLKWFYSALIWNKSRSKKIVYLTFDDGPIPNVTDFVLNTLKSFNAKATFFCIGDNITKHPEVFERVKNAGHAIGNHTFNHLKGWKTDDETYIANFLKCQQLTQTPLFRPPYGQIKKSQISKLKAVYNSQFSIHHTPLQIIMWDVISYDFNSKLSSTKCFENVIKHSKNGSIIVFHDSLKAFDRLQYALPQTLKYFSEKGYQFGTL